MEWMWRSVLVGWGAVALSGCGAPPDLVDLPPSRAPAGVAFYVADTSYTRGDTIRLVVENHGPDKIGFNLCGARLEHLVDGSWSDVSRWEEDGSFHFCYDILNVAPPGGTASELQPVLEWYEPGVYRFRYELLRMSEADRERIPVTSNGFRVERRP
jgi:hypothetical protein